MIQIIILLLLIWEMRIRKEASKQLYWEKPK